jgi:hypothetical protein
MLTNYSPATTVKVAQEENIFKWIRRSEFTEKKAEAELK